MAHCNENYLNLQGAYLFAEVRKKQEAYKAAHPDANIISLGIGDVTQPLAPVVIEAMKKAVEEMGHVETFSSCVKRSRSMISRIADVIFLQTRSLSATAQSAMSAICRRSLQNRISSRSLTRCTRSMWTAMSWPEEVANSCVERMNASNICRAMKNAASRQICRLMIR